MSHNINDWQLCVWSLILGHPSTQLLHHSHNTSLTDRTMSSDHHDSWASERKWEAVIYGRACSLTTDRLVFDRSENQSGEPFQYGKTRYSKAWLTPAPRSKGYQTKQESIHRASINNAYHHFKDRPGCTAVCTTTKTWVTLAMQEKDSTETDDTGTQLWNTDYMDSF